MLTNQKFAVFDSYCDVGLGPTLRTSMSQLEKWLYNQRPFVTGNVTLVKETIKFLHISQDNNIKEMYPRISWRQSGKEDRTIPRICGAPNLRGCILGHTIVRSNILEGISFIKDQWKDNNSPIYYIYQLPELEYLRPSNKLVPEVNQTDEVWITPYCPEAITVKPKKIGRFLPYRISQEIFMGESTLSNVFYLELTTDIMLSKFDVAGPGYFQFSIDGDLVPFNKCHPIKDIKPISKEEWNRLMKKIK